MMGFHPTHVSSYPKCSMMGTAMLNRSEWGHYWAAEEVVNEVFSVVAAHVAGRLDVLTYRCTVVSFEGGRKTILQYRWFARPVDLVPVIACAALTFDVSGWPVDVRVYVQNNITREVSFETKFSRIPEISPDELVRRLRVMVGLVKPSHILRLLTRSAL